MYKREINNQSINHIWVYIVPRVYDHRQRMTLTICFSVRWFKHWWNLVLRTSLIWHCVTECSRFWRRDNDLFGLWKYFSKWHASRVRILICTISTHTKRHFKLFSKAVYTDFVYAMEMAWNEILLLIKVTNNANEYWPNLRRIPKIKSSNVILFVVNDNINDSINNITNTRKHSSRMHTNRAVTRPSSERVAIRPIVDRQTPVKTLHSLAAGKYRTDLS